MTHRMLKAAAAAFLLVAGPAYGFVIAAVPNAVSNGGLLRTRNIQKGSGRLAVGKPGVRKPVRPSVAVASSVEKSRSTDFWEAAGFDMSMIEEETTLDMGEVPNRVART